MARKRRRVSRRTGASYAGLFERYTRPAIGQKRLESLQPSHIRKVYGEMQARGHREVGGCHTLSVLYSRNSILASAVSGEPTLSGEQNRQMSRQNESGQAGVRAALDHYFRGHATGDASHMRKAFLPTAHIEGIREGVFTSWTLDAYCALFKGEPAGDESTRVRTIDSIDVSGSAAAAKATLDHGATVFTDYFVLLKVDGEWRIANKVYHGQKKGGGSH